MSVHLVGLDLGSQSAKVVVHDEHGAVVAVGREPLSPTTSPRPGQVEHPDDDLWRALCAASRQAMSQLRPDGPPITGVGLCGVRFCRAPLRADGTLMSPVQSWMDERVSRPHDSRDGDVAKVTASSGYLTHRLTGEFRDAAAAYQGQWPIDSAAWGWQDDAAVRDAGLRPDQLAELAQPGEVLGTVTAAAAEATGLPAAVPVVATANDKAVEALGAGLRVPGDVLVSLGTYIAAMTVGTRPTTGASYWTNFASVPGEYLHESTGIRRGMWTVSWVRRLLGDQFRPEPEAGDETGWVPDDAVEEAMNGAAMEVSAGCDGLLTVLDWLPPTDAPWRRGAFVGLDERHGPAHLYRSVLEGIALTTVRHARAMTAELGLDLGRVIVSGGGARSDLLSGILASAFDRPVSRRTEPSAAALGAAVCAAVGVGVHPSWDQAGAAMVGSGEQIRPVTEEAALYAALGGAHADLVAALEPVEKQVARIISR